MNSSRNKRSPDESQLSTTDSMKRGNCRKLPLESISRVRQTISFASKRENLQIISPLRKIQVDQFIEKTIFLVDYYHKNSKLGFYQSAIKFLNKDWIQFRAKLNERLNKIIYLEPTLKYKSYSEIQTEIMKEWKKNHILYALQTIWFNSLLKNDFQNPEEFQQEYEAQKNFIAQLAYLMSKPYFQILEQNNFHALDKLTEETAHFIITNYEDWKEVYSKIVTKLYTQGNYQPEINFQFDLFSLEVEEYIVDRRSDNILPRTVQKIKQFSVEIRLLEKIKLLKAIRTSLEEEIKGNQELMMREGNFPHYKIIEKDDFITCLICCLVKGEISNLGLALKMFSVLLGPNFSMILSKWGVDSYRADLESAFQFLIQNSLTTTLINISDPSPTKIEVATHEPEQ